jgi:signal transduction histidine kinase
MQEITRARRFTQVMTWFWVAISYLILASTTFFVMAQRADLRHGLGLLALLGGVALYGIWYTGGYLWLIGPKCRWLPESLWRRSVYWLCQLACALVLMRIDPAYVQLQWIAFGIAVGFITWPWMVPAALVPTLILVHSWGVWPTGSAESWVNFIGAILGFAVYAAIIALPSWLVQQRFAQARLYRDLEAAHADLAEAHARLAASAEHERELAVLRERERLAHDLHDTLGHALVLATMKLEVAQRLAPTDASRAGGEIAATQDILRDAMHELRATLAALHASPPTSAPVTATLAQAAHAAAERAGFALDLRLCETSATWPLAVQAALTRIGAEAITNAERHAHARHLALALTTEGAVACLIIRDDGVGLPALPCDGTGGATSPAGHFGLAGMRARVVELGGAIAITSAPDQGTAIAVRLPLAVAAPFPLVEAVP